MLDEIKTESNLAVWIYIPCVWCMYNIRWQSIQITEKYIIRWDRVTHICVSELTIIGSDDGLAPTRCQAIIWTNVGILLIEPLGTNCSEILIEIHIFSFEKTHFKVSSAKYRPFCLGLNVMIDWNILHKTVHRELVHTYWSHIAKFCKYTKTVNERDRPLFLSYFDALYVFHIRCLSYEEYLLYFFLVAFLSIYRTVF